MSETETKCAMIAVIGAPPDREGGQTSNGAGAHAMKLEEF